MMAINNIYKNDLDKLVKWSDKWQMLGNVKAYKQHKETWM